MTSPYLHYGWELSFFSGKSRSYLKYKGVPFNDIKVNMRTLLKTIPSQVGATVMPVIKTPQGEWLQDTSEIIDYFEERFPSKPVIPTDPLLRFASKLFEAWADEWWIPIAMHTRWTYPENHVQFRTEAGDALLPYFPRFIKNKVGQQIADKMQGFLPRVGVVPDQVQMMNDWTYKALDLFEDHFSQHRYLLGNKPSLMDFALMGPLYGHLSHDPWPAREMIAPRPNVKRWIDAMAEPKSTGSTSDDQSLTDIPETLKPIFQMIFSEFMPMVLAIAEHVKDTSTSMAQGDTFERMLGKIKFPMGKETFSRNAIPFTMWMIQRLLDDMAKMDAKDQDAVKTWVEQFGGGALFALKLPRLGRKDLRVYLAEAG